MTPTAESVELTDKQELVLKLTKEGKSPTEIGKAFDPPISSQAVHGHLRRLREHGALPGEGARTGSKVSRTAITGVSDFDVAAVILRVRSAADEQRQALDQREAHLDAEIARLREEKKAIANARSELNALVPPEGA